MSDRQLFKKRADSLLIDMGISDSYNELYITEEGDASSEYDRFVISEEIQKTDQAQYDYIYSILSNANINFDVSLPMYDISWRHLIATRHGRLLELVLIYSRLDEKVAKQNIDSLICSENLDKGYVSVVKDIANAHSINIEVGADPISRLNLVQRFMKNSFLILPFLLSQTLTVIWGSIWGKNDETELIFVPSLGRLSSTLPVLDKIPEIKYEDYLVLISSKVSPLGRMWKWEYLRSDLDDHNLIPLSGASSIRGIYKQLHTYMSVSKKSLLGPNLNQELSSVLMEELGVDLDKTITYSIYEGYRTRVFLSIFFYYIFDETVDEYGCENIVIGGLSPSRRAILHAGIENDCEVYYIPHGIGAGSASPNPPKELIHLVSGCLEKSHYSKSPQVQEMWNCIVTGRPYLTNLYEECEEVNTTTSNAPPLQVLVATQPLPGRKELVDDVINVAEDLGVDIVIKTHPSESRDIYSEFVKDTENVSISESNLFDHLEESDITITINSNVGLESIIVGTPTIAVNKWKPRVSDPLYSKCGPIPVVRDADSLYDEIEKVTLNELDSILTAQFEFVYENFELDADATQNMADVIVPKNQ